MDPLSSAHGGKTILVVEDEAPLLELLEAELTKSGYRVFTAKDGVEGLQSALTFKPDLILLDIMMPKMDGLHMLQKIRSKETGKKIHVIVLSNLNDADAKVQAFASLADDYLVKTETDTSEILKKIKKVLA